MKIVSRPAERHRYRLGALVASASILVLAGCSSGGSTTQGSGGQETLSDQGPITIWSDATRMSGFKTYKKTHTDVDTRLVTYSATGKDLQTKVALFNQTGDGWPDAVQAQQDDVTWATSDKFAFAQPLEKFIPQDVLDGFPAGSLAGCTVDGHLYCLKNDATQSVLWYNQDLMDEFGYTVPTTWEEFTELGLRLAQEHPGYIVGSAGDGFVPRNYYAASQCPGQTLTDANTVHIDLDDPKCTRVTDMIDQLLAAGSMSRSGTFSPDFIKQYGGADSKLLMSFGPPWFPEYVFDDELKIPAGQMAAAMPPRWADEPEAFTSDTGGSIYMVSSHSKNLKAAIDAIVWMATDDGYQLTAPTMPAYGPEQVRWLKSINKDGYYSSDPSEVLVKASSEIWPGWSNTLFDDEAIFSSTVLPRITAGDSIASAVDAWQTELVNQARQLGYEVVDD